MSNSPKNNLGFSVIEVIIVLAILVIIGAVGYLAYSNFIAPKSATNSTEGNASTEPIKIENAKDLDTAGTTLDNVSLDDSETSELDSAISSF